MPHDRNGKVISVGDEVIIQGKVTYIGSEGSDYCNVTVEIGKDAEHGPENIHSQVSLNAKQVEKV